MINAVIFDMDGLLIDSEPCWDAVRKAWAEECGVMDWGESDHRAVMGVSTLTWANHMIRRFKLDLPPEAVIERVVSEMAATYRRAIPWKPGALAAVELASGHFKVGLASGSEKSLIQIVVADAAVAGKFEAVVCTDDMPHGKPAPDVYLEAARQLGVAPAACVCLEDSGAGIQSGNAAGMRVIAVPDPRFPPRPELLALAGVTLGSLEELTLQTLTGA
jgi:beta-phosphoglucomutase-like phosphatase (HAD superfamily)